MALSENTGGTQAATLTTEHTLATITAVGTYVLVVDTSAMVNGDVLELRIKTKVRSASSAREAYVATYAHVQGQPNKYSVPIPSPFSFAATLKQTLGTGRSYDWSIYQL